MIKLIFWNVGCQKKDPFTSTMIGETEESNDDSVADKDYIPSSASNHSDESENEISSSINTGNRERNSLSKSANLSANVSGVLNISNKAAIGARDDTDLIVQRTYTKSTKKYFCMYCKKLFSKLPRHLENVHSNEENVKKISALPAGMD